MAFGAWLIGIGTFAATCFIVGFFATNGLLLGAPVWAWGLAGTISVVGVFGVEV